MINLIKYRSVFISQNKNTVSNLSKENGWVILNDIEAKIKRKIEEKGTPLKHWDVQINYGIKTGFNEAFIIDAIKREELLENCPEADEIIRPILRGRDIKKYTANFANQYIINTHNGSKNGTKAINTKNDYPAIFEHLLQYETALAKRQDKGQHWSNLRNCAYLEDLEKEKIIWIELTDHPNFTLDTTGIYLNNTIFFMTGLHLKYLLTYLNSRLCEWYFDKIAATSGVGTRRWIKIYIDQICAIKPNPIIEEEMNILADKALKNNSKETLKEIDLAFYKLFDLDSDQIDVVEKANL